MSCSRRYGPWILVILLPLAATGYGAGFALYEGSARGNALGGALTAQADDPSALFYNPAGITQLEGKQFMAGLTFIAPSTEVTVLTPAGEVATETEANLWTPPHLYGTWQMNDRLWLGLGMYSRFGLGTEFDENWPGRYNSYKAFIQTLSFNPNVAFKVNDNLSLAAGVSAMWFDLDLRRKLQNTTLPGGPDLDFKLCGDSIGYGLNAGARFAPTKKLAFGVAYQSEVKQEVEGDASVGSPLGAKKGDAEGDVTLPDMVFLGMAVKPLDKLTVEVGAARTGWSSYDQLAIDLDPTLLGLPSIVSPKQWEDVWRYQLGAEYALTEVWTLRAGYTYDEEPGPSSTTDYLVPANDRNLYSVGVGYQWKGWQLDLSYTYLDIRDRHIPARLEAGVLESDFECGDAHLVGVSVSRTL